MSERQTIIYALAPIAPGTRFRPKWAAAAAVIKKWNQEQLEEFDGGEYWEAVDEAAQDDGEDPDHDAKKIAAVRELVLEDLKQLQDWWSATDTPDDTTWLHISGTSVLLFEPNPDGEDQPEPFQLIRRMESVLVEVENVLGLELNTF